MPQSGFVFVELYTQDIPYYISLFKTVCGMQVLRDEGGFAELRSDTARVLLNADTDADLPEGHPFRGKVGGPAGKGVGVEIGVVVADLQAAHQAASGIKGCTVSPVLRQEWGLSDFRVIPFSWIELVPTAGSVTLVP